MAILRTTPVLLGLFSGATLMADELAGEEGKLRVSEAAWYRKEVATFSDALAAVRRSLWKRRDNGRSGPETSAPK